jgi:hypothetical protein
MMVVRTTPIMKVDRTTTRRFRVSVRKRVEVVEKRKETYSSSEEGAKWKGKGRPRVLRAAILNERKDCTTQGTLIHFKSSQVTADAVISLKSHTQEIC